VPERWRAPFASSDAVRLRMSAQRSRDTAPELALRRRLHGMGLRYRVHTAPVAGLRRRADIVFGPARVAVFVDGCFWHGCPLHGQRRHDVNGWYWPDKIARNRIRDADTDARQTSQAARGSSRCGHDPPPVSEAFRRRGMTSCANRVVFLTTFQLGMSP